MTSGIKERRKRSRGGGGVLLSWGADYRQTTTRRTRSKAYRSKTNHQNTGVWGGRCRRKKGGGLEGIYSHRGGGGRENKGRLQLQAKRKKTTLVRKSYKSIRRRKGQQPGNLLHLGPSKKIQDLIIPSIQPPIKKNGGYISKVNYIIKKSAKIEKKTIRRGGKR